MRGKVGKRVTWIKQHDESESRDFSAKCPTGCAARICLPLVPRLLLLFFFLLQRKLIYPDF